MAKPASLPTWSTTGTRTDPAGAAAAGFTEGDRFPAEWANYLFGWLSDWAKYLSDQLFVGDVETDTQFVCQSAPDVAHGLRTICIGPSALCVTPSFSANSRPNFGDMICDGGQFSEFDVPIELQPGQRFLGARVIARTEHSVASDITARAWQMVADPTVPTAVPAATSLVGVTNLPSGVTDTQSIALTPGAPVDIVAGSNMIGIRINVNNTASDKHIYRVEIDVDRPA